MSDNTKAKAPYTTETLSNELTETTLTVEVIATKEEVKPTEITPTIQPILDTEPNEGVIKYKSTGAQVPVDMKLDSIISEQEQKGEGIEEAEIVEEEVVIEENEIVKEIDWSDYEESTAEVLRLLENNDYDKLTQLAKEGKISYISNPMWDDYFIKNDQIEVLVKNLSLLIRAIQPLVDRRKEVAKYIDLDSPIKVKVTDIIGEWTNAQLMTTFSKDTAFSRMPFMKLIKSIRWDLFGQFDMKGIEDLIMEQEIDMKGYMEFIELTGIPIDEKVFKNFSKGNKSHE